VSEARPGPVGASAGSDRARRKDTGPAQPPTDDAADVDVTSLRYRRADRRWNRTAVGDMLERMTWSYPDRVALAGAAGAYGDARYASVSYADADATANRFANALLSRGLRAGHVVALLCENSVEAFLAKLGTAKAGLVVAPINPSLAPDVVTEILGRIEASLVVVDAELWPRLQGAVGAAGLRPDVTVEIGGPAPPGSVGFSAFVADQPDTEPDVTIHGDDIWELLFTSGTTATPKAVMLSHTSGTLGGYGFALSLTRGLRIEDDLVLCSYLPLVYHVGDTPFGLGTFAAGGTLVLGRRPEPDRIAETVASFAVTALWAGSPQLLRAVAERLEADPDRYPARSLRVVVYGWAALHPDVLASLQRVCAPELLAVGIFGQTECIPCHRFWPARDEDTYRATAPALNYVGVPSPLLASQVMAADGTSLEGRSGVPGEAVYRSPVIMAGYYKDPEATRHALRFGWFHSGDSCVYDERGLRIMVDRYKDVIKSGGENVSSLRVEAVLVQHPAVARAAVVGLPHEHWGEAVTALVVPRPGASVDAAELIGFCRSQLAGFETPKGVIVVDGLPETVGGKVLKYRLRAEHAAFYLGQTPAAG